MPSTGKAQYAFLCLRTTKNSFQHKYCIAFVPMLSGIIRQWSSPVGMHFPVLAGHVVLLCQLQIVKDRGQNYGVYHHMSFTRADVWWCVSVLINYMYQVHVVQYGWIPY